jgi:colanic acid/amylovoran biosynthesis protein
MIHVLQTGTYCSRNKGDAAMQLVVARMLPELAPDVRCIVGTPFPALDGDFYSPVPCVRSSRRNLVLGSLWLACIGLLRLVGIRPRRFPLDEEINTMASAAAVVDLSGDMLTEDYGLHVGYSHLLPLMQALLLGKPLFVLAQSIGPFRFLSPLAKAVLRRATLVTAREPITFDRIKAMRGQVPRFELTADLAFLLPAADSSRVDAILSSAGFAPGNRRVLGVSVSALLLNRLHGSIEKAKSDPLSTLAKVLDVVSARHDLELLLVSHVTGPRERSDDRRVAIRLKQLLKCNATVLDYDLRPEELKGVISHCHAFFGFRMHANIAALDSGVPVLAVSYSHKTLGIMQLFGMDEYVVPFSSIDDGTLEARLDQLITCNDALRLRLREQVPGVRSAARRNLELLVQYLRNEAPAT